MISLPSHSPNTREAARRIARLITARWFPTPYQVIRGGTAWTTTATIEIERAILELVAELHSRAPGRPFLRPVLRGRRDRRDPNSSGRRAWREWRAGQARLEDPGGFC